MKIQVEVSTKKVGSTCTRIIDVDEGTDTEIGEQALDYILEDLVDWTWEYVDDKEKLND